MKRSNARSEVAIEFAKSQRQTTNEFVNTVWQWLRNRQCCGVKFRREFPIPPYTVDFCCAELGLVIEIDGEAHFTESGLVYDRERDLFLIHNGYRVLRIKGFDVIREDGKVPERMHKFVSEALESTMKNPSPPAPLPGAGRGEQEV